MQTTATQPPVTYGANLRKMTFDGFTLNETLHEPGFGLATHSHPNATVAFVAEGEFEERLDGRTIRCGPGSLLAKPSDQPHANRYGASGARCLLVEVDRAEEKILQAGALDRPIFLNDRFAAQASGTLARELAEPDGVTPLVVEGVFLEFLGAIRQRSAQERGRPAWLRHAVAFLDDCFSQPLRIGAVARAAGVHPIHLTREFRRHLGIAPGQYVRRRRLGAARDLLENGRLPIAAIAQACGFSDQSHLTRRFTRHYGVSPGRYRRRRNTGSSPPLSDLAG